MVPHCPGIGIPTPKGVGPSASALGPCGSEVLLLLCWNDSGCGCGSRVPMMAGLCVVPDAPLGCSSTERARDPGEPRALGRLLEVRFPSSLALQYFPLRMNAA